MYLEPLNSHFKPKWGSTLNKLQQKQTQLILYPQYVMSKEKKPRRIPLVESLEKNNKYIPFIRLFILFLTWIG